MKNLTIAVLFLVIMLVSGVWAQDYPRYLGFWVGDRNTPSYWGCNGTFIDTDVVYDQDGNLEYMDIGEEEAIYGEDVGMWDAGCLPFYKVKVRGDTVFFKEKQKRKFFMGRDLVSSPVGSTVWLQTVDPFDTNFYADEENQEYFKGTWSTLWKAVEVCASTSQEPLITLLLVEDILSGLPESFRPANCSNSDDKWEWCQYMSPLKVHKIMSWYTNEYRKKQ